jgi:hypothetical protein
MNEAIEKLFLTIEENLTDPRKPRGVRHPFPSIIKLLVVGLMCRLVSVEQICVLACQSWDDIKEPLGFTRKKPPHPTTITRLLNRVGVDELSALFIDWMSHCLANKVNESELIAAVDGKTAAKQSTRWRASFRQ